MIATICCDSLLMLLTASITFVSFVQWRSLWRLITFLQIQWHLKILAGICLIPLYFVYMNYVIILQLNHWGIPSLLTVIYLRNIKKTFNPYKNYYDMPWPLKVLKWMVYIRDMSPFIFSFVIFVVFIALSWKHTKK